MGAWILARRHAFQTVEEHTMQDVEDHRAWRWVEVRGDAARHRWGDAKRPCVTRLHRRSRARVSVEPGRARAVRPFPAAGRRRSALCLAQRGRRRRAPWPSRLRGAGEIERNKQGWHGRTA
eukprot:1455422-Pleurochrysis_carterae.AAC.1